MYTDTCAERGCAEERSAGFSIATADPEAQKPKGASKKKGKGDFLSLDDGSEALYYSTFINIYIYIYIYTERSR